MGYKPAGFWVRFLAKLVDGILISIPVSILLQLTIGEFKTFADIAQSATYLFYEIMLLVSWNGQTIGKRLVGIQVKRLTGEPVDLYTALVRQFFVGVLYSITFGILGLISLLFVVFREDKRAIHDLMAQTEVVYK